MFVCIMLSLFPGLVVLHDYEFERFLIVYVYRVCFDIFARIFRTSVGIWKWLVKSVTGQFVVVWLE